jgi:hypothetical protein
MISQETVNKMKARGELLLTERTFNKSVIFHDDHPRYEYKSKRYYYKDYLLTYGHDQYERLHNNHQELPEMCRIVR